MAKLKRLATWDVDLVCVHTPVSLSAANERAKQYDLLSPKRFGKIQ